ncbi:MAG TPA: radical SAM protein [Thermoanaerobaculia bacterium]|jgi:wyosine [tRNA(Phe)-imidazoG37] synthetase (radical SAM superfamily)|nr:radical SAM protein [Thermoanaerobaculia bacterium]
MGEARRAMRWAHGTFDDFVFLDGQGKRTLSAIAYHAVTLVALAGDLDVDRARKSFAASMLSACASVDSGQARLASWKLRSYEDISVQVATIRRLVDYIAARVRDDSTRLTEILVEESPNSRPALLVRAELLIEQSRIDEAIELIQRALRILSICPVAQELLGRAMQARRLRGDDAGKLDGLSYNLSDKFCHVPFTHLSTASKGETFLCCCPGWLPFSIGNVLTAPSAEAVWNSDAAVEIRRSVLDGDYKYCSRTLCSYIGAQKLPRKDDIVDPMLRVYIDQHKTVIDELPLLVQLNHDPTCNLACPSCRTEIVAAKAEEQDTYAQAAERVILPLLRRVKGQTYISGGGEPFSSKHFRSILGALNRAEYPGLSVYLVTNGLLLSQERWSEYPNLPEMIEVLSVSIDAAHPDTYERLRRPGKWPVLMRNLEMMAEMRRSQKIRHFQINMVVQADNFRELLDFVALGKRLGVDDIWLQRLTNYGAFDEATFARNDVTSVRHPDHAELLEILRNPLLQGPGINAQMLMPLLPEVVASDLRLAGLYSMAGGND